MQKIKLCVNVDHIATLRQARGGHEPDPAEGAAVCEKCGAAGITVHLREDRRHIQDRDVEALKKTVKGKFNLEMALSDEIIEIAWRLAPDQITLVPERREEITTEGGLDVAANLDRIKKVVGIFKGRGTLISFFIEPDPVTVERSRDAGADYIEIHTGSYCNAFGGPGEEAEIKRIYRSAERAVEIGIGVNAGHGLNARNLPPVLKTAGLEELNIGHSIISRSVFIGLDGAVRELLDVIDRS